MSCPLVVESAPSNTGSGPDSVPLPPPRSIPTPQVDGADRADRVVRYPPLPICTSIATPSLGPVIYTPCKTIILVDRRVPWNRALSVIAREVPLHCGVEYQANQGARARRAASATRLLESTFWTWRLYSALRRQASSSRKADGRLPDYRIDLSSVCISFQARPRLLFRRAPRDVNLSS
ncbi:hypothetical protein NM688_g7149 [Phlebia brevispora]|uniref:Uncharacterized protein n=1 Tax=Phlebia brevispora TaxID=194682 RepID=A0ACC1S944_9APHY|nr:hypothetical protein NM688_g7149 [Phlebia brevispora]